MGALDWSGIPSRGANVVSPESAAMRVATVARKVLGSSDVARLAESARRGHVAVLCGLPVERREGCKSAPLVAIFR